MAVGGPDAPQIVLTVEDVARIAADVARTPELKPELAGEERQGREAELGFVSTPEGRAWARRALAEARERRSHIDVVGMRRAMEEWIRSPAGSPPWADPPEREGPLSS